MSRLSRPDVHDDHHHVVSADDNLDDEYDDDQRAVIDDHDDLVRAHVPGSGRRRAVRSIRRLRQHVRLHRRGQLPARQLLPAELRPSRLWRRRLRWRMRYLSCAASQVLRR